MYNSINYLEISCNYNHLDLVLFSGALANPNARRVVVYRNRQYFFSYDRDDKIFYIVNKENLLVAAICESVFKFYVCNAPEIGLNLIWGLLARLNIYPVTAL